MKLTTSFSRYQRILRQMVRTRLGSRSWLDDATYFNDAMATWGKAASFLQSEKFWHAYHLGERSGHKLNGPYHLHIEWRVHIAICMAVHASKLEGDFVECGVNTGNVSLAVCDYLDFEKLEKRFYLFDTYEGIPPEQVSEDERAKGRLQENENLYFPCYDLALKNFAKYPNAILVKGRIPETLTHVDIPKVCYLHLDMNIALPELAALQHFWPKMPAGTPILMDDYGWAGYSEQRLVLGRFARDKNCEICELPTGQGLLIKPSND